MKLRSWSYSTLKTYKQCPAKVGFNKIKGIKEPSSPAMDRGTAIHLLAETFVKEKQKVLPEDLLRFTDYFMALRVFKKLVVEEEWAFTTTWEPCEWDSPNAWVRMKIDLQAFVSQKHMRLIDYKTGKVYEDNRAQLSLYALGAFIRNPKLQVIEGELWYLDQGVMHQERFERYELEDMKAAWNAAAGRMMNDEFFAPRPGHHCKWCFYAKNKNGNCEYGA